NSNVNPDNPGSYFVQYIATDPSGNSATNTRTVNVVDTTPPTVLYAFTNLTLEVTGNCLAALPDLTGTNFIVAIDNCSSVTVTQSPPAETLLSPGTNIVVLTAFDSSGNTATSPNFVVVSDTSAPSLLSPVDVSVNSSPGLCLATNVDLGLPTVSDNCAIAM